MKLLCPVFHTRPTLGEASHEMCAAFTCAARRSRGRQILGSKVESCERWWLKNNSCRVDADAPREVRISGCGETQRRQWRSDSLDDHQWVLVRQEMVEKERNKKQTTKKWVGHHRRVVGYLAK